MIVVDASALAAIFFIEPDAPKFLRALQQTPHAWMSAANYLEVAIIIDNRNAPEQMVDLDLFSGRSRVGDCPGHRRTARVPRDAYRRFGRGNHPAGLDFGDCLAYALAKERDLPLLFKGEDFPQIDLRPAL